MQQRFKARHLVGIQYRSVGPVLEDTLFVNNMRLNAYFDIRDTALITWDDSMVTLPAVKGGIRTLESYALVSAARFRVHGFRIGSLAAMQLTAPHTREDKL
jgi:hypothetical protein